MKIDVVTLFPKMFEGILTESIIKRAQAKGVVDIAIHYLRDWTADPHKTVDDRPYGGGAGMVVKVDVAYQALKELAQIDKPKKSRDSWVILPTPKGKRIDQKMAQRLSKKKHLVILCPHYEGYDERIVSLVDEQISLGDFILTGGEIPALAIIDSVVRLVPGAIKADSLKDETFTIQEKEGKFGEYPQYTRPEIFEAKIAGKVTKKRIPPVLKSGNHAEIAKWRGKQVKEV
ncbi:MAG: tRNA (guanosine(37)-N1)-methyltransferase TrmD [Patescibacteria group bacterium]